ncbi:helix-turn-helix transcriptional regulator [Halomonas chromatireducens]|uniref:HTH-type transcriptional activator Btr n=1 Tax=Halomonas chromatireducens TaxID=507626 RepID=A0A125R0M3_9GAMM|nr:DNA-binding response regulator [Halomonas chromatireducens]AMD02303.1 HTH-type transcriptional activator Btr [Halomonas chromatireducens]
MIVHEYVLIVVRNVQGQTDSDFHHALKQEGYRTEVVVAGQDPVPIMQDRPPIAVCFQFDYPDFSGLTSLRETKQAAPSVPLLMITQAHSEHLAVWAFRARVWDYLVEPVDTQRFIEVMAKLYRVRLPGKTINAGIPPHRSMPQEREVVEIDNSIPHEARLHCSAAGDEQARLQRAISYIDQNLHRRIAQQEMATLCGLSAFQFSRFFKRLTGITFQEYLLHRRINEAMRLLANPKVSITDVCFTVGFRDLSYFTRTFQRYVGKPPSRYRLEATQSTHPTDTQAAGPMPTDKAGEAALIATLPALPDPIKPIGP